ncbi:MAG: flagellar motor stator protein MotA [Acidobacteria bacterium]|nr:flagellar motor stator protein MotA [Acidobacteriota bacterium]
MLAIVGIVVVFGAVIGGFLLEKGQIMVLVQPAELLIIGGAALGTILVANPLPVVVQMGKGILRVFGSSPYTQASYLEALKMLYAVFQHARKEGLVKLEADVDDPAKSQIFARYPKFLKDHSALHFVCDTLRTAVSGGLGHFELDQMMEMDMEVHHQQVQQPVAALTTVADSLPGLGIVAAVLGVVITMGALGGPPEVIGHKVAAALVGTFLGILLCYGLFGPLAGAMSKQNDAQQQYLHVLRAAILAFVKGVSPILAVEFGRRAVPHLHRPTFARMEAACRQSAKA